MIPAPRLNLFYEEPDPDRWLPFDRYPRRIIRRVVRGAPRIGGQTRVFLNLCAGLDRIGVPYRVNDYRYALRHPEEVVCIIGKYQVLTEVAWRNPILAGAALCANPIDDADLLQRYPIKKIQVPGQWAKDMCRSSWGDAVEVWPVGIDTVKWCPTASEKTTDVLLYDKVRWEHDFYENEIIDPIRMTLRKHGRSVREIRYGHYREEDFHRALAECRVMIFLCEHETQGIAYQQALSCGVPIFAWDRGGPWQDPAYYPHKCSWGPVTSVPYWDDRCGRKFVDFAEFASLWPQFWEDASNEVFRPRDYINENLTLEACARDFVRSVRAIEDAVRAA